MVECVHHYDLDQGKNYYYYNNPQTGKFQVHPWDVDQTWSNMMFGNGSEPFKTRVLDMHAEFRLEYQNRLREVLDLLFDVEPMRKLIEEFAAVIRPVVEADRRRWDYAPEMLDTRYVVSYKAGVGKFYEMAPQSGFEGMVELMKNWVVTRRKWITDELLSDENEIPRAPSLSIWCQRARGCTPLCNLVQLYSPDLELPSRVERKHSGETIVGSQWRVALDSGYEIEGAVWLSRFDSSMEPIISVQNQLLPQERYRARLRLIDDKGRWSHWSQPVIFACSVQTQAQLAPVLSFSRTPASPVPSRLPTKAVSASPSQSPVSRQPTVIPTPAILPLESASEHGLNRASVTAPSSTESDDAHVRATLLGSIGVAVGTGILLVGICIAFRYVVVRFARSRLAVGHLEKVRQHAWTLPSVHSDSISDTIDVAGAAQGAGVVGTSRTGADSMPVQLPFSALASREAMQVHEQSRKTEVDPAGRRVRRTLPPQKLDGHLSGIHNERVLASRVRESDPGSFKSRG